MYTKEKLSKADYSPRNVAPLIEFFSPIVKKVVPPKQSSVEGSFNEPTDDCWVHFDGIFITGTSLLDKPMISALRDPKTNNATFVDLTDLAYVEQNGIGDVVGNGNSLGNIGTLMPNAVRFTFDSIAVPPNVGVKIKTENGELALDVIGPIVIYNSAYNTISNPNLTTVLHLMTANWDRLDHKGVPWEETFPQNTRKWSNDVRKDAANPDMRLWSSYEVEILCDGNNSGGNGVQTEDYNIAFKYKYYNIRHLDPLGVTPHSKGYFHVQHPHTIGDTEYTSPLPPSIKSKELKHYESVAKKSWRLERWKKENDVQYDYFL